MLLCGSSINVAETDIYYDDTRDRIKLGKNLVWPAERPVLDLFIPG